MQDLDEIDLDADLRDAIVTYDGLRYFAHEAVHTAFGVAAYALVKAGVSSFSETAAAFDEAAGGSASRLEASVLFGVASYMRAMGDLPQDNSWALQQPMSLWGRFVDPVPGKVFPMTHRLPVASKVAALTEIVERSDRELSSAIERSVEVLLEHLLAKQVLVREEVIEAFAECYDKEDLQADFSGMVLHGIRKRLEAAGPCPAPR